MNKLIRVVYDKQCPACNQYCVLAEKFSECEIELIDVRDTSVLMDDITRLGLDIDEGMVVEADGQLHYGADAIHVVAKMGPRKGLFNRANRLMFSNTKMATLLYPLLRSLRNLLLKILGVNRINNLGEPGNVKF